LLRRLTNALNIDIARARLDVLARRALARRESAPSPPTTSTCPRARARAASSSRSPRRSRGRAVARARFAARAASPPSPSALDRARASRAPSRSAASSPRSAFSRCKRVGDPLARGVESRPVDESLGHSERDPMHRARHRDRDAYCDG